MSTTGDFFDYVRVHACQPAMTRSDLDSRERYLFWSLLSLTAVTGLVDAVSFLGLGRIFTANMTGNIVLLRFALAGAQGLSVARSGAAIISFAGGSALGAHLATRDLPASRQLLRAIGCEVALFMVAAAAALGPTDEASAIAGYVVIACMAIAMGLRSAVVRRIAVPDMTTTVLTSTLVAFAADSFIGRGRDVGAWRRALSIVAMIAGAFVGAVLLDHFSITATLAFGAAALTLLALYLWNRSGTEHVGPPAAS